MSKERVLFAASEVYPFAKTGGLADVAHALPRALCSEFEVQVVMPLYRSIDQRRFGITLLAQNLCVSMGEREYPVALYGCTLEGVEYLFVYSPLLCDREYLYGPPEEGYGDNALRFGLFNRAIVMLLKRGGYGAVHLNDWQCALVPLLVSEEPHFRIKTLFTIHNLAYQGVFDPSVLPELGIDPCYFTMEALEFYGRVNFMKAGIAYADTVTTVSPTYAREILTPEFGCGLEGFLQVHRCKLVGIANGIDTEHFSPRNDPALFAGYSDLKGKRSNKSAYLKEIGLRGVNKPLYVFIGRFTWQKGVDLLINVLPKIAALECNVAILGEGEKQYAEALSRLAEECANLHLHVGYDESLSHRMYAAADFLLMPSLFEPCGLNQMIAMAYGALPVVHRIGGLADTVRPVGEFCPDAEGGFGITFARASERSFFNAIRRSFDLYGKKRLFHPIVRHDMGCDFSWNESAKHYAALYRGTRR